MSDVISRGVDEVQARRPQRTEPIRSVIPRRLEHRFLSDHPICARCQRFSAAC